MILFKERPTTLMYISRNRKNLSSNHLKKGRNKAIPPSAGSCPLGTGLSSEAQSTGVRIKATNSESIMAAMMVTENWR